MRLPSLWFRMTLKDTRWKEAGTSVTKSSKVSGMVSPPRQPRGAKWSVRLDLTIKSHLIKPKVTFFKNSIDFFYFFFPGSAKYSFHFALHSAHVGFICIVNNFV